MQKIYTKLIHKRIRKLIKNIPAAIAIIIRYDLPFIIRKAKYRSHYHPKTIDWQWEAKRYNRVDLVNYIVERLESDSPSYLEIGCFKDELFNAVKLQDKTGVDSVSGGTHRMTSDRFFKDSNRTFDIIFIDGLHHYQQVRRDAINSLNALNSGGWIAFHDFLPSSWEEQHVPRLSGSWTGDCWKFAVELGKAEGLAFQIVTIDYGILIMQKLSADFFIPDLSHELATARFDRFLEALDSFPLCDFDEAKRYIARPATQETLLDSRAEQQKWRTREDSNSRPLDS